MNSNDPGASIDIHIDNKPGDKADASDGEIEVLVQEPNPYKKVKLNEEQPIKKKHDHDKDHKSKDTEEKRENKHKHKDGSKGLIRFLRNLSSIQSITKTKMTKKNQRKNLKKVQSTNPAIKRSLAATLKRNTNQSQVRLQFPAC
jgi:hypothetical protein